MSIVVFVCRLQAVSQRLVYNRFIVIVANRLALSNQNRRYKTSSVKAVVDELIIHTLISDKIALTCGCLLNTRVLKQVGNLRYV